MYVSTIPEGFNNDNDIYNFMPANIVDRFFSMRENEFQQTVTRDNAQYFTFKSLGSINVNGIDGVMIENDNVLDAQDNEKNRRILLKRNGLTYIIGNFYRTQQDLDDLHKFLMSFKFL